MWGLVKVSKPLFLSWIVRSSSFITKSNFRTKLCSGVRRTGTLFFSSPTPTLPSDFYYFSRGWLPLLFCFENKLNKTETPLTSRSVAAEKSETPQAQDFEPGSDH